MNFATTNHTTQTSRWMDRALVAMLAVSLSLNAAMAWKLRQGTLAAAERARAKAEEGLLKKGTPLPAIEAVDAKGAPARIEVSGANAPSGGTLLYVFASQCGWCERNHPNFDALARAAEASGRYRVVMLALDEGQTVDEYVRKHGMGGRVYRRPSEATFKAYNLGATPGMVVISPDGKVDKHWLGAWTGKAAREVEEHFGVKLPGVAKVQQASAAAH